VNLAGWLLVGTWIAALAYLGGEGPLANTLVMAATLAALLAAALAGPRALRPPPLAWWWLLAAAVVLPPLLQALPLGVGHPWAAPDHAALGTTPVAWALDPDAAARSAAWGVLWAATAWLAVLTWRGQRAWRLAAVIAAVAAIHALVALPLSVLLPDWPFAGGSNGRVRGTFFYVNQAACMWGACLPLALALSRADAQRRGWWLAAAAALFTAVILSASRGGILTAALVAAPFAWNAMPHRRRWLWSGAALLTLGGWLAMLNLAPVQQRFEQFGTQGVDLSGRMRIWTAAAPQVIDAGPWGAGPGTEILAFLRGGSEGFQGQDMTQLLHLHSDPLAWLLAYGWVGSAALLLAIAWAIIWGARAWRRLPPTADPRSRRLAMAAGAGVGMLALHSCGDFIWFNNVLSLLGALLLAAAAGAADDDPGRQPRAGWRWRLAAAGLALAVGIALLTELPRETEANLARTARSDAYQRQQSGLPIANASSVQRLLGEPVTTTRAANTKMELSRITGDVESLRAGLAVVTRRSPAQPMAWAVRAQLAVADGDAAMLATALGRLRAWAPTWITTRFTELRILLGPMSSQLDPARRAESLRAAFTARQALPPIVLAMAEAEFGVESLAVLLVQAEGGLLPQAEEWLAMNGTLDDWLAVRRRLPRQRPPAGWLLSEALGDPPTSVPGSPAARLEAARALGQQRLPAPPPLLALLGADGPPGSLEAARWPAPGSAVTTDWLRTLAATAPAYRGLLHVPAGRQAYEEAQLAAALLDGHSEGVRRDTWPPLTALALDAARSDDERARLGGIAAVQLARGWEPLPEAQGNACWWDGQYGTLPCHGLRWTGLAIDGTWIGWRRGDFEVTVGPGLHRVQLLTP
jgi:hypothetical protein